MSQPEKILTRIRKSQEEEAHLFSNFEKFYNAKDNVKASEFLWGSVSKLAYLIGLVYGLKLGRHGELVDFLRNLARQQDQSEILDWISAAESLHSNFYHNWMDREVFEEHIQKVVRLRNWLLDIFEKKLEETNLRVDIS